MQELEQPFQQVTEPSVIWQPSILCRLCGNTNDYLIPIFKGEGVDHQLHVKISQHLHLEVTEEDFLPTQICYPCASTLLAFHELSENTEEANKRLSSIFTTTRLKPVEKDIGNDESFFTDAYSEVIQTSCRSIPEKIIIEDEHQSPSKEPTKKQSLEEAEKITCVETVDKFLRHTEKEPEHGDTSNENYQVKKKKKKKKVKREKLSKCPICGKVFHFVHYLKSHLLSHSDDRPHLCHICGASFKRKDHANHHRRTVHVSHPDVVRELEERGEEPVSCDQCGEVKPTKHSLFIHMKRHSLNCVCDVCNISFSMPSHLKSHMVKVHASDMFPCDICGEMQRTGHALYIHKKKHSNSFICDVCGKSFTQPSSLRTHMVIHSEDKPYTCEECGKSFKLKARLQIHKQLHGDSRPYACNICENKRFKTKSALIVHNNMHNDTRPYPCPHCSFRARKNSDLVCHVRTHTGEKPYKCGICGRGFAQAGDMRKHRSIHDRQKLDESL